MDIQRDSQYSNVHSRSATRRNVNLLLGGQRVSVSNKGRCNSHLKFDSGNAAQYTEGQSIERLDFPSTVCEELLDLLHLSTTWLPPTGRQMGDLHSGFLRR